METMLPGLLVLLFAVLIFLIFREIFCWYWKINQTVELLKDILFELKNTPPKKRLTVGTMQKNRKNL